MKRFLLCILAVMLLCAGCGSSGKLGKSVPEEFFKLNAKELNDLTLDKFKEVMTEDGILYNIDGNYCSAKTTESFMGYDCLYVGEFPEKDDFSLSSDAKLSFVLDLGSGDRYKEARKKLDDYFDKNCVKNNGHVEWEQDNGTVVNWYTLDSIDAAKCCEDRIDKNFTDLTESEFNRLMNLYGFVLGAGEENATKDNFAEQFKKGLSEEGYQARKIVTVVYTDAPGANEEISGLHVNFDGTCCVIMVGSIMMTDAEYIQLGAEKGYDVIADKPIDLDTIDKTLRSYVGSSGEEIYGYYMMKEHGFDIYSGETSKDSQALLCWSLKHLEWDLDKGEKISLADYFNSANVYIATTLNRHPETGKEFKDEAAREEYLYQELEGDEVKKRLGIMQLLGYDPETGAEVDRQVAKALRIYYTEYAEKGRNNKYAFVYVDDDDIPEIVYPWNRGYYLASIYNGKAVRTERNFTSLSYYDHGGLCTTVSSDSYVTATNVYNIMGGYQKLICDVFYSHDRETKWYLNGNKSNAAECGKALSDATYKKGGKQISLNESDFCEDFLTAYYNSLSPERSGRQTAESASAKPEATKAEKANEGTEKAETAQAETKNGETLENEIKKAKTAYIKEYVLADKEDCFLFDFNQSPIPWLLSGQTLYHYENDKMIQMDTEIGWYFLYKSDSDYLVKYSMNRSDDEDVVIYQYQNGQLAEAASFQYLADEDPEYSSKGLEGSTKYRQYENDVNQFLGTSDYMEEYSRSEVCFDMEKAISDYDGRKNGTSSQAGQDSQSASETKAQEPSQSSDDYILPDSGSRYLTEDEIRALSKDEMRLARNEVYARHGRKFDAEDLQAYFGSKPWYNGTTDPKNFDESVLNEYEKANLDLIRAVEGN